jgi:hypothetical protein
MSTDEYARQSEAAIGLLERALEMQSDCFFLQVVMEVEEEVWRVLDVGDHETPGK